MRLISSLHVRCDTAVDTDALSRINSIFTHWQFRDRFDVLNATSNIRFARGADALPKKTGKKMRELMDARATELLAKYESDERPIVCCWSGGVDSTALLCAFLRNGAKNLKVLCSQESINEYPWFYQNVVSKLDHVVTESVSELIKTVDCSAIMTGWCADQLFGSNIHLYDLSLYNKSAEEGALYHLKRSLGLYRYRIADGTAEACVAAMQRLGAKLGLTVERFCEFAFLYNFAIKWTMVKNETNLELHGTPNFGKGIPFFESQAFQDWAFTRYDGIRERNVNKEVAYYKLPLKQYIYGYTKDEDYLKNKGKVNSWRATHFRMPEPKFVAYTDEGLKVWKPANPSAVKRNEDFYRIVANKFRKNHA